MAKVRRWVATTKASDMVHSKCLEADQNTEDANDMKDSVAMKPDGSGQVAPAVPTPSLYIDSLNLHNAPLHAARSIHLPITETPSLTNDQHKALKKWATAVQRSSLPNGLSDIQAASISCLPFDVADLSSSARKLVESSVSDVQRKMEETNVHAIQHGYCAYEAQRIVLKLSLTTFSKAENAAVSKLGVYLDGLCRAVAEFPDVLGSGGWRLLQRARRALREWLRLEQNDGSAFNTQEAYDQVHQRLLDEVMDERVRRRACLMAVASWDAVECDLARDACGDRGETTLEGAVQAAGVCREAYLVEDELREAQTRTFGKIVYATPDLLFRQGVLVNGSSPVHWIDSKGTCILPGLCFGSQLQKLKRQLTHFVELFGPGLVVWQGGFASVTTEGVHGVRSAAWSRSDLQAKIETSMQWQ